MSSALQALTATTGNRTDCWNTPRLFIADVIEFFDDTLILTRVVMIRITPTCQLLHCMMRVTMA